MKKYIIATEELMKILSTQNLTELNYEEEGFKVTLKKPFSSSPLKKNIKKASEIKSELPKKENFKNLLSEGIGYFHSINKNGVSILEIGNFLEVGKEIGHILAMGVKTPVISSESGTIEEIYVLDGDTVDFNKPIVKLKK